MNDSMESRPAGSAYGKCDQRIDVLVPEDVQEMMIALARQAGMTTSEYGRLVFERHCFGAAPQIKRRDPLMG
jgi:hypothetical protein